MRYTAHQFGTLAVASTAVFALSKVGINVDPVSMATAFVPSGLVDLDIYIYTRGHRMRSPFHVIDYSIVAVLLSLVLVFINPVLAPAFFFALGWFSHLFFDFLQGGVRSKLLNRRVGITLYRWDTYCGAFGYVTDFLVVLLGLGSVYLLYLAWPDIESTIRPIDAAVGVFIVAALGSRSSRTFLMTAGLFVASIITVTLV